MNPTWEKPSEEIKFLKANGTRLIKVYWKFLIDKMDTSSETALQLSAADMRQKLSAFVNGELTSFDVPKSETKNGLKMEVGCWTRGIVG